MTPDELIFQWMDDLSRIGGISHLLQFISNDYFVPIIIVLVMLALWFGARSVHQRQRNQWAVVYAAVGVGFTSLIIHILNRVLGFDPWLRPFEIWGWVLRFGYEPSDPSFPANSAAVGFAFATGICMWNRKAGILLYTIASLWSFSRLYVGIHYPLDLLGGMALGVVTTWVFSKGLILIEPFPTLLLRAAKILHLSDIPEDDRIFWRPFAALREKTKKNPSSDKTLSV